MTESQSGNANVDGFECSTCQNIHISKLLISLSDPSFKPKNPVSCLVGPFFNHLQSHLAPAFGNGVGYQSVCLFDLL